MAEVQLSDSAFDSIVEAFGLPEINLFASRSNAKCSKFISWKKDSESFAVDAFTISWEGLDFYAFPPPCLILRVLQKIKQDKAQIWLSQIGHHSHGIPYFRI